MTFQHVKEQDELRVLQEQEEHRQIFEDDKHHIQQILQNDILIHEEEIWRYQKGRLADTITAVEQLTAPFSMDLLEEYDLQDQTGLQL